jgi:hypothetical protein
MKHRLFISTAAFLAISSSLVAQNATPAAPTPSAQTSAFHKTGWPGIEVRIYEIRRITKNHLLFVFNYWNSSSRNALLAENIRAIKVEGMDDIRFDPHDVSKGATLTDEGTDITYKPERPAKVALPPSADPAYLRLRPNDSDLLSVAFFCPPPPPQEPGAKPKKQTVAIKLPNVETPFRNITIPQNEGEVIRLYQN